MNADVITQTSLGGLVACSADLNSQKVLDRGYSFMARKDDRDLIRFHEDIINKGLVRIFLKCGLRKDIRMQSIVTKKMIVRQIKKISYGKGNITG